MEKIVILNFSLLGFDVIDDIKVEVEKECEGIVFCVDILVFVVRDFVFF